MWYKYLECNSEELKMKKNSEDAEIGYADRSSEDSPATMAEKFRQADALIDEEERTIPPAYRLRDLSD